MYSISPKTKTEYSTIHVLTLKVSYMYTNHVTTVTCF